MRREESGSVGTKDRLNLAMAQQTRYLERVETIWKAERVILEQPRFPTPLIH